MSQGLRNESYPEYSIFGTEFTHIAVTPPPPLSFYVSPSLFLPGSSSSFSSSITPSILIRRSPLDVWMVSVPLSVCLVLQTPSHQAGPPVVPGSMLGMQGMAQWTIRRKFPAADRTKYPETTLSWTITREKWKGWRQRVGQEGMGQDAWTDIGWGLRQRQ